MKKKVKISSVLMVLVPFILCLLVQVLVGAIGGLILSARFSAEWIQDNIIVILTITHCIMAISFGFWYWNVCQNRRESKIKDAVTLRSIVVVVLYALGLLVLITGAYDILDLINPEILEGYGELMETAGLGSGLWSIVAAVFLAPIGEECVFRGLTLYYLDKVGAKFWLANIVQALLFGIMHGNIVQGTYAFVLGLLLGQVANKYKSIFVVILFHMVFNLFGSTVAPLISTDTLWLGILIRVLGLAIIVIAFILCSKDTTRERQSGKRLTSFSYYKAYTSKKYRIIVHIILPVFIALLGCLTMVIKDMQGTLASGFMVLLLIVEASGDYVAFGSTCSKEAAPINYVKSSFKGEKFFSTVYRWDVLIRFIKYTAFWLVVGLIPILSDNWNVAVLGYLLTMISAFVIVNIVRRIDNIQILSLFVTPIAAISAAIMTLVLKFEFLSIPVSLLLFIAMIFMLVLTYKLSMLAYKRSFRDV